MWWNKDHTVTNDNSDPEGRLAIKNNTLVKLYWYLGILNIFPGHSRVFPNWLLIHITILLFLLFYCNSGSFVAVIIIVEIK